FLLRAFRHSDPIRSAVVGAMNPFADLKQQSTPAVREPAKPSFGEAASRGFASSAIENLLGVPALLSPEGINGGGRLRQIQKSIEPDLPGRLPTKSEVMSALSYAGQVPAAIATGDFNQFLPFGESVRQQEEMTNQMDAQRPFATALGGIGGEAEELVAARRAGKGSIDALRKLEPVVAERAKTVVGRVLQSARKSTQRSLKNAGKTGAEIAALEALKEDGRPAEAGAIAAAVQGVGDLVA